MKLREQHMEESKVDGRSLRYQHRKPELLDAATEYILNNGIGDLSLRPFATALGTSHASLLRHFSSKNELIMSVLDRISVDVRDRVIADPAVQAAPTVATRMLRIWERLCEPREQRQFLVLFELVSRELRSSGDGHFFARNVVSDWLQVSVEDLVAEGWTPEDARVAKRLFLAQVRGLQLDLLFTGERAGVDAAIRLGISIFERPPSR